MAKVKIKKKNKHFRSFDNDLKNGVVAKNINILKKNKKDKKRNKKSLKKRDDFKKILNLANEQNKEYIDYRENGLEEKNIQVVDNFLDFDDNDMHDTFDYSLNGINDQIDFNKLDYANDVGESNDIIQEIEAQINKEASSQSDKKQKDTLDQTEQSNEISPLVKKCYKTVGEELSHFKSGKLHKAIKILTQSSLWFELLLLTNPNKWTTQATLEVTKLLSSGLKHLDVSKYYEFILLPIILDNVEKNKKLNPFLYKTLIKALYKSNAWFEGILFPLLQKECTKNLMTIIGSVIQKMSISINCAVYALNKIFKMQWSSTIGYILNVFFNKKYSFTKEFIDNCVDYFVKFQNYSSPLTMIWHKSLLTLVYNYKELMDDTHLDKITTLIKKKNHHKISSEILNHMYSSSSLIKKIKDLTPNAVGSIV